MNEIPTHDPADDGSLAGVLRSAFGKMLQGVDGMLPAQVLSYDRKSNTAAVKPLIQVLGASGKGTSRAQIARVPVLALGGGGFVINFPLKAGDLGWIEASDRDISLFMQGMAEARPNTLRKHSFSDGRFIPDIFGKYEFASEDEGAMLIQSLDGQTKIALSEEAVTIKAKMICIEGETVAIKAQGMTVSMEGGSASFTGKTAFSGETVINGHSFDTHAHTGAQPGSGKTGGVA